MNNSIRPVARKRNLVIQDLDGEVLVYDLDSNKAHCLNESAAIVWKNCDGVKDVNEIAKQFGEKVNDDFVWLAIDQLSDLNLLDSAVITPNTGSSRREVLKKIGLGTVIALPVISSLATPSPVYASVCSGTVHVSSCGTCPPGTPCSGGSCGMGPCTCQGANSCCSGPCPSPPPISIPKKS